MTTLVIYDNEGFIIQQVSGSYRLPVGIPYLEVDVPEGKRIKVTDGIGVDTAVTPHQVTLEDIPPSDVEALRLEMAQSNTELFEMMISMSGGTT